MGWRDVLADQWMMRVTDGDFGVSRASDGYAASVAALLAMPAPDRIALARELLAGTGRVDARAVPPIITDECDEAEFHHAAGWNACRAAMLATDDAGG